MNIFTKRKLSKILSAEEIEEIELVQKYPQVKRKISEIVLRSTAADLDKDLRSYPSNQVFKISSEGAKLFASTRLNRICLQWIKKNARIVILFAGTRDCKIHVVDTQKYGE